MLRNLIEFNGDGLIVAGGWCSNHKSGKPLIRCPANFYSVDINKQAEPDAVIDITDEIQCSIFPEKRFSLIYFECFPFNSAYEKKLEKSFNLMHRLLREDGILIYVGGSDQSASSIPTILKNAGYLYAVKKELNPADPKTKRDNGSISLASNIDIALIQKKFTDLSEVMQYYLTYYKFFSEEPYSNHPLYSSSIQKLNIRTSVVKEKPESLLSEIMDVSGIISYKAIAPQMNFFPYHRNTLNLTQKNGQSSQDGATQAMTDAIPSKNIGDALQLGLFPTATVRQGQQKNTDCEFKPGFLLGKKF